MWGIQELYPHPKKNLIPSVDVVAVHGLGGDSYSTWTTDSTLWLRDLLPSSPLFQDARIMTFGYDAKAFLHPFEKSTTARTFTFAEALLSDLADKRVSAAARRRPIIFLGHSLGGLVIKSALRHARALYSLYGDVLDSTRAVVFFGTPHQGTDSAVWATYLGDLGKALGLRNTEVAKELKRWSYPLVELTTHFSDLAPNFQITTFFEKKKTHGILVVPEASARMGQQNERTRGLEADHNSVCKFTEVDPNWQVVLGRMEAIAETIAQELQLEIPNVPIGDPISEAGLSRRFQHLHSG